MKAFATWSAASVRCSESIHGRLGRVAAKTNVRFGNHGAWELTARTSPGERLRLWRVWRRCGGRPFLDAREVKDCPAAIARPDAIDSTDAIPTNHAFVLILTQLLCKRNAQIGRLFCRIFVVLFWKLAVAGLGDFDLAVDYQRRFKSACGAKLFFARRLILI